MEIGAYTVADVGLDVFGVGEHHRPDCSAPEVATRVREGLDRRAEAA